MTIIFLTRRFYPLIGGVEKHVLEISKKLIKKGHRIIVVTENSCDKSGSYFKSSETVEGIEIVRISPGKDDWYKKFRIWIELWKFKNIFDKESIVHCHDVFFWYLPYRILYPFKKVYTTFHGYEGYPITKKAIIVRKISEKLSKGNICIGEFIAKWYGTKPTFISYGGVNVSHAVENAGIKQDSAFFFGRLDKQTGIDIYIKAFKLIKKKFPRFKLLVIGEGDYRRFIPNSVQVVNFSKNPQKYFLHYNFVFVSRYLSILEALAEKKIVIATYDDPIKKDYLLISPFAKYIYICRNAKEVARVVESVRKEPWKSISMVENGYSWASEQTWNEVVSIYLQLWKLQQ